MRIATWAELLYDLVALGSVVTLAYFFPLGFLLLVGPALLVSLTLMLVERKIS